MRKTITGNKKWLLVGLGILLIVIIIIAFSALSHNGKGEIVTVEKRDLTEIVRIAGRVEADMVADLGFETAGTVRNVSVKVNDKVYLGQNLATLSLGTLPAELKSAQAEMTIKEAELDNQSRNLDAVKKQQDTLVENSYDELLSSDLVAEPVNNSQEQTPPEISGRYSGPEGKYKIQIDMGSFGDEYRIRTFELEKSAEIEISKTSPTSLGTRGLFISFPDDIADYNNTTWYVKIPNKSSSTYSDKLSSYESALRERSRAIEAAEAELRQGHNLSSVSQAELTKAEAAVEKIQAQIAERTIVAPFSGTVSKVDIDPGSTVSSHQGVISVISEGKLGVELDLPEIDSVKVMVNDKASIQLDAFGQKVFEGTVVSVNRSETLVDGVPVYEARVIFDNPSPEIVSGMTADVTITTDEKTGVLSIPIRALETKTDGSHFVKIIDQTTEDEKEVEVKIGLESTDGYVEILSGLIDNEKVLID